MLVGCTFSSITSYISNNWHVNVAFPLFKHLFFLSRSFFGNIMYQLAQPKFWVLFFVLATVWVLVSLRNVSCAQCCQVQKHQQNLLVRNIWHFHIESHLDYWFLPRAAEFQSRTKTNPTKNSKYEFIQYWNHSSGSETAHFKQVCTSGNVQKTCFFPLFLANENPKPDNIWQHHFKQFW